MEQVQTEPLRSNSTCPPCATSSTEPNQTKALPFKRTCLLRWRWLTAPARRY